MFNFMRLPPLRRLMLMKAITGGGSWSTIVGNPVSFTAKAAPLKQLSVAFSPVQSGTGDPSPDNVRPILGWDSLDVYHSGADTSNPQTIYITLGSTFYSGTLDVVTGVVTVTWAAVNMGSLDWSYTSPSAGIPYGYFDVTNIGYKPTGGFMCSCYKVVSAGWAVDKTIRNHGSIDKLYVIDGSYDNKNSFKQAVTGQYICYELATPLTIQLTPQEVQSLAGDNTMWSDANGDLTVEYRSN